jgi:hypothetical protein
LTGRVRRGLIVVELAHDNSRARVYWRARTDNASAPRLYDRFGEADRFVWCRLFLD